MSYKPVHIFGFIMSFAYVFIGLLMMTTNVLAQLISEHKYRVLFGGAVLAYGIFRARYSFIKLRKKE